VFYSILYRQRLTINPKRTVVELDALVSQTDGRTDGQTDRSIAYNALLYRMAGAYIITTYTTIHTNRINTGCAYRPNCMW